MRIIAAFVAALAIAAVSQWVYLRQAHRTFENYYAFRGCTELLSRTDEEGTCRTKDGAVITIVKYQGRWYLENDLPWACIGSLCVGF